MTARLLVGDALEQLRTLPSGSVRCCVTSPPYWGLRDYGVVDQLGLERTPDEYVAKMVAVFREVRRVLADDGTLWLNLGDSYANDTKWGGSSGGKHVTALHGKHAAGGLGRGKRATGLKSKDLVGIPWMVAFALRADGWYLRSDIIWHKPNPMPESVRDRPTKAHEYVFLLSKAATYYYDADAIAEASEYAGEQAGFCRGTKRRATAMGREPSGNERLGSNWIQPLTRNARSVWTIATKPFSEAHFATMPVELAQRCVKAGSAAGDMILDPFAGAGTTLLAAVGLGRSALGIELNPEYAAMARTRCDSPLFTEATA